MRFLNNLDLLKNELRNAAIQNLAGDPSNPVRGQIYFNTQENELKVYNGEDWDVVGKEYYVEVRDGEGGVRIALVDSDTSVKFVGAGGITITKVAEEDTIKIEATGVASPNSLTLKFDGGTTEGTDQYVFNGSAAKTIDFVAGNAVTLTKTAGSVTIASTDTATAADDILDGSNTGTEIKYAPYATAAAGKLSSVVPTTGNTVLGYSGYFYANRFNDLELTQGQYGFTINGGSVDRNSIIFNNNVSYQGNLTVNSWTDKELRVFSNLTVGTVDRHTVTYVLDSDVAGVTRTLKLGPDGSANGVAIYNANAGLTSEAQLAVTRGGTGQSTFTDGQLLIGKTDGTLAKAVLTAGSNVTITNGDGAITIASAHPTISAASSVDNNGVTFIQDVTLDGNGHVTGLTSVAVREASDTQSGLVSTGTQTFGGNKTFANNVIVTGNLTVNGTTTTLDTETVNIKDNIIQINSNQTGTPSSSLVSGIEVNRGTEPNFQFVFVENSDDFRLGKVGGTLQPVLTRDELANLTAGDLLVWDADNKRSIGKTYDELNLPNKFAATIEDIETGAYEIEHGLNSTDVVVSLKEVATGEILYADIKTVNANKIEVSFAQIGLIEDVRVTVIA
jgi:hypothetical protein